ncbi:MAG: hypothetical protein EA368_05030 [Leptolyngbya sp. DLM2.Bin27]|nr:MAG: hypothetical protein EA368_05030 [Leptolyngbya sp. DLM2.Bin27]
MDDSPFRRIVLPSLLAASAGFAALTWPLASDHALRFSDRLPQPIGRWAESALITNDHKEFSIRYVGFAILSSVAIGTGMSKVMRSRQGRLQRHQDLLAEALALPEESPLDTLTLDLPRLGGEIGRAAAATNALDWASLLPPPQVETPALAQAEALSASTMAIDHKALYQLQAADQQRCLALAVEGEYYRYYRHRPSLDQARSLVQHLHQRGQRSIATLATTPDETSGDADYVVWVQQTSAVDQATPWLECNSG